MPNRSPQAEFCPPPDTSLVALLAGLDLDAGPLTPPPPQLAALRSTILELALHADNVGHRQPHVLLARGVSVIVAGCPLARCFVLAATASKAATPSPSCTPRSPRNVGRPVRAPLKEHGA
ncbi:hypothetical protein B0H15DRAFT_948219 [Mycena belliarum]|uniref:Uncharacterized protein n=1 Tax=Mycena belliarum TaxID=1033014 RepID=A0AAD6XW47_9AGAR|nr:hypothetical protein B0H15DRAFT_948219 [Mycena belliae]